MPYRSTSTSTCINGSSRWFGVNPSHKGHSSSTPDIHQRPPGTTDLSSKSINPPITTSYPYARIEAYRVSEPFEETDPSTVCASDSKEA